MMKRRTIMSVIGAVALTSAFYFPMSLQAETLHGDNGNPIKIVVPYPAGGPLDVSARALAEAIEPELGTVIVENRPGAGGGVGMSYVKRQKANGHTMVIGAVATQAINPHIYTNLRYDALKDFTPVTLIADVPNVLLVTKEFAQKHNIHSVADLEAYAKAHPGELNVASGGNGSGGHMALELFKNKAGLDMVHVPFAGAAAARLSVLAGQTDLIFDNLASAQSNIDSGALVPLAVSTKTRAKALPNVPTMQEAGVPDFDISTWYGVFVPAGTPEGVVQELNTCLVNALNSDALKARLSKLGGEVSPMSAKDFKAFVEREYVKYGDLVKVSGAKPI